MSGGFYLASGWEGYSEEKECSREGSKSPQIQNFLYLLCLGATESL